MLVSFFENAHFLVNPKKKKKCFFHFLPKLAHVQKMEKIPKNTKKGKKMSIPNKKAKI